MKNIYYTATAALLLVGGVLGGATACLAAEPATGAATLGTGTYSFWERALKGTENATMAETITATRQALNDLNLPISREDPDGNHYLFVAHSRKDKVTIELEKETAQVTNVEITVGTFGDESYSRLILQHIEDNLPKNGK